MIRTLFALFAVAACAESTPTPTAPPRATEPAPVAGCAVAEPAPPPPPVHAVGSCSVARSAP